MSWISQGDLHSSTRRDIVLLGCRAYSADATIGNDTNSALIRDCTIGHVECCPQGHWIDNDQLSLPDRKVIVFVMGLSRYMEFIGSCRRQI